ncbi:MAG: Minf_1886 family protein [Thermoguttaceae bacterium]|jgi:uncharacterized repeat protein (TIGR04138 family)
MIDPATSLLRLLREDRRYKLDAYAFVSEAINYAHEVLKMGSEDYSEPVEAAADEDEESRKPQRHVTGQELCRAIREYALRQYGLMAKTVLNSWGVHSTSDFGEIVFNLIRIGHFRKTKEDRREDFDHQFDFDTALEREFRITLPE